MTRKKFLISLCTILLTFLAGWKVAKMTSKYNEFNTVNQAMPVVRFDRFDKSRNAFIIGLFNPGGMAMEVNHTELLYKTDNKTCSVVSNNQNYSNKPLVLDPGDTILIPLQKKINVKSRLQPGDYWGRVDFKISGQADFFSLHHKFSHTQHSDKTALRNEGLITSSF